VFLLHFIDQFTRQLSVPLIRRFFYQLQNSIFSGLSTQISFSNDFGAAAQRPSSGADTTEKHDCEAIAQAGVRPLQRLVVVQFGRWNRHLPRRPMTLKSCRKLSAAETQKPRLCRNL
jgi:hypothetical protein